MKSNQLIVAVLVIALSTSAYAQQKSGVNTKNPQSVLHVDAKKDNNSGTAPTATQQANDFIVTQTGNVGIGNTTPTVKLMVDNSVTGGAAIKILDGSQAAGYVLTSDANGVGTWTAVPAFRPTVLGAFPTIPATVNSNTGSATIVDSGVSIFLAQGKWAINAGMTFSNINTDIWQHCYLSSSNTAIAQVGFTHLGPARNNTTYAGVLLWAAKALPTDVNGTGFISGSSVIDVTAPAGVTIYLVFQKWATNIFTYATSNSENYFYAVPVQ